VYDLGGPGFEMSELMAVQADKYACDGEVETALYLLDEAVRWPDTAVGSSEYASLAKSAAGFGKHDLALALLLDNQRMHLHQKYEHLDSIPEIPEGRYPNEDMIKYIGRWLELAGHMVVTALEPEISVKLAECYHEKIEVYLQTLEHICEPLGVPGQEVVFQHAGGERRVNSTLDPLWRAVRGFVAVGAEQTAIRLAKLDPRLKDALRG